MVGGGWVAQQNRVTPSLFDFRLWTWTLDLDLDCGNYLMMRNAGVEHVESNDAVTENILYIF